jgi:hypothetical protein
MLALNLPSPNVLNHTNFAPPAFADLRGQSLLREVSDDAVPFATPGVAGVRGEQGEGQIGCEEYFHPESLPRQDTGSISVAKRTRLHSQKNGKLLLGARYGNELSGELVREASAPNEWIGQSCGSE